MKNGYKYAATFFGFFGLLIASWFFVHFLAIFGIFLALLYPLWWLLVPQKHLCLLCRVKRDGEWCPLCQMKVSRAGGVNKATLRSALLNSGIIFIFTVVSIAIVFGESRLLRFFGFPQSPSTVTFAIPNVDQHAVGEVFPMKMEIDGVQVAINAVQADISFDPTRLEVVEISTDKSFATIFIQKEINNTAGYARLTGGLPNPGFSATHGLFGTVYFKAKSPGPVSVKFLPTTMILANDGQGRNVLKDLGTIHYLILSEKVSSAKEQDQKAFLNVLGASTSGTQMIFYDEGEEVLGADASSDLIKQTSQHINISVMFLTFLGKLDNAIIAPISKLFLR